MQFFKVEKGKKFQKNEILRKIEKTGENGRKYIFFSKKRKYMPVE